MKIGNWLINEHGIEWIGKTSNGYKIAKETLKDVGQRKDTYDWPLHLSQKTWLTESDIYALNTALIYALEYFNIGFDKNISFVKTFVEQQKIIKSKSDE